MIRHAWSLTLAIVVLSTLNLVSCSTSSPSQTTSSSPSFTDEEAIIRFYEIWNDPKRAGFWGNTWFGISTLQNPMDVWITQEIISEVKPDFIIETGTLQGGSAALWATILEQVNPDGRVITIDIDDTTARAKKLSIVQRKVDFYIGSSTDPKIVADIKSRVQGKKVLVILDSLHAKHHVYDELQAYGDLVSVGSYMIVQDSFVNGHPITPITGYVEGPWEAIEAFLPTTDKFEVDKSKERLIFTYNPNGFLQRVR